MRHVFVLLSGGIDSSTVLHLARRSHSAAQLHTVGVYYGQRHFKELDAARAVTEHLSRDNARIARHELDLSGVIPSTMLTNPDVKIPEVDYADMVGISPTYVPFRNGLMLSAASSFIQGTIGEEDDALLYFGAHAEDAENWAYPDCTPEFIGAMANAIFVGTYQSVRLIAPFMHSTKADIIAVGARLGVPYELTWSCYVGDEQHCGTCPTCRARKQAFRIAGCEDPTEYAK